MATTAPKLSMDVEDNTAYTGNDIAAASHPGKQPQVTTTEILSPVNKAFTAACFSFRDNATKSKQNRQSSILYSPAPSDPASPDLSLEPARSKQRSLRKVSKLALLSLGHHTLTSLLSVAIASLQLATYVTYTQTKDIPNAWPTQPTLSPTITLMVIALLALALDVCIAVLYCIPSKRAASRVEKLGSEVAYLVTGVKGVAYVVGATACRSAFDAGGGRDLWGWTCSAKAREMGQVNKAGFNCGADTAAWVLAIAQVVLEAVGVLITTAVSRRGSGETEKDEAGDPLLASEKSLLAKSEDVQAQLADLKGGAGLPSVGSL